MAPVIQYYRGPNYNGGYSWPSAECHYSNFTVTSNCPDNEASCTVTQANNCEITDTMIICDIIMCFFFITVLIMNVKIQKEVEETLDEEVQTAQDYSVVVNDPTNDADNPDEWMKFFSDFGVVRYVTVTKCNTELIQLLYKKKKLLQRLKAVLLKENNNEMPQVVAGESQKMVVWNESMDTYCKNVDTYYVQSANVETTNLSFMTKLRISLNLSSTRLELLSHLKLLEVKLQEAYLKSYPVNRVYVTFEHEKDQKTALDTLEVADYVAYSNAKPSQSQMKYAFRRENVLDVCQSEEPASVLWPNEQVNPTKKSFITSFDLIVIVAILAGCYFAIDQVQYLAKDRTPLLVVAIDLILPYIFTFLTDIESKNSQTIRQKELHRRLFFAKLFVSTLFPYATTSWNEFLTAEKLIAIRNTQFLTSLVSPVIKFLDMAGICIRQIVGPCITNHQGEYNELWYGQDWSLAERYVEVAKILCIIVFSTFLLPQSLFIGAISFIMILVLDRYSLLRKWKQFPMLGLSVCKVFRKEIMLAIAIHMYATR